MHPLGVLKNLHSSVLTFAERNGSPLKFCGTGLMSLGGGETSGRSDAVGGLTRGQTLYDLGDSATLAWAPVSRLRDVIDGSNV